MAQESKIINDEVSEETATDNLVSIGDSNDNQVLEINQQMTALEGSIDSLNKKLNTTNRQIKKDIKRLDDSDLDINEKVADAYKQLGVIDANFQALKQESSTIAGDIKLVNKNITALEKASAESLNQAIDAQSAVNQEFRAQHDEIVERAEKLSKKAKTIATKLDKSIKENSKALTELEARIVSELESVAQLSEQRDSQLDEKIAATNDEVSAQKAKLLLMQSVDEALDKRAAALESTAEALLKDSASLKASTRRLDTLTAKLVGDVEALEIHTAKLAEQNIQQQGFINALEDKASDLKRNLLALADLEKSHFRTLGAASLALLLALIALFGYGEYMRNDRNEVVDEQVANLQTQVQDEQMASQVFNQNISNLEQNVLAMQEEIQDMNDQVESLDGRMQYMAPLYNFGSDNTIHGSHWLEQLAPEKFSIKIATVSDKQELYEIAQRYNYYFEQDLGYFLTANQAYTLIYGGQFGDEQQVMQAMQRMPRYMNNQRIGAISNAEVLDQVKI